ncbi:hypothetical protein ABPG74_000598 [Tetrahymena malaccensis]
MLHKIINKASFFKTNLDKYNGIQIKDVNQQKVFSQNVKSRVIGIHLGNTNSYCAITRWNHPQLIYNFENQKATPSYISFLNDGNLLIGQPAKNLMKTNPLQTFYGAKRFIGMKFDDPILQKNSEKLPKNICRDQNGDVCFYFQNQIFTPTEICLKLISQLMHINDFNFRTAIITVPDNFNYEQRIHFRQYVLNAGISVRIINQSVAALFANGLGNYSSDDQKIAVYHLGGNTFQISIFKQEDGIFELVSTQNDIFSGGEEINNLLSEYLTKQIILQTGINISECQNTISNIKDAAEKVKCELSSSDIAQISLEYLLPDSLEPKSFNCSITRFQFEDLCQEFLKNTIKLCEKCLVDSGYSKDQINHVVLTGGSTRIPFVVKLVSEYFGKQIYKNSILPDEDKAIGAAAMSFSNENESKQFLHPFNLGIELADGFVYWMIDRSMKHPISVSQDFSTTSDNQTSISIKIILGVNPQVNQNKLLQQIDLTGITPLPKGTPKIKITLAIEEYNLTVSVKDMSSNQEQEVLIKNYSELNEEEERIISENYWNQLNKQQKLSQ